MTGEAGREFKTYEWIHQECSGSIVRVEGDNSEL